MEPSTFGILGFVVCLIASRYLSEQAFKGLSSEQKLILMDGFSTTRAFASVPLLFILGAMLGLPRLMPDQPFIGLYVGLGLLIVFVVGMHIFVVKRLRALGIDENYQRGFLLSRHVSHLGVLCLFGSLLFDALKS